MIALKNKYYCFLKTIALYYFKVEIKEEITRNKMDIFDKLTIALYSSMIISLIIYTIVAMFSLIIKFDILNLMYSRFSYFWTIILFLSIKFVNYNFIIKNHKFLECNKSPNPNLYLVYLIGSGILSLCCLFLNKKYFS